jgi:hypothetical protein
MCRLTSQDYQLADNASIYQGKVMELKDIKLSDTEVLTAFPETSQIIAALMQELTAKRKALVQLIADKLALIYAESKDEIFRYFWTLWLTLSEGEELQQVDVKLARLHRLQNKIDGKPTPKGALSDGAIEAARKYPIQDLFNIQFRHSGNRLVGLCPWHIEKSGSFFIFLKTNTARCFGCGKSQDSIAAFMELHGCDFKTAVNELSGARA